MDASTIRRLDWRFLLPAPEGGAFEHLLLGREDPDLADLVREAGVARRVSAGNGVTGPFDVAVLLAGSHLTIEDLRHRLRPGAPVYLEIDRRRPGLRQGGPGRLGARLAAVGLGATTPYWAVAGFRGTRAYLPIGSKAAVRWYVSHQLTARTAARRLLRAALTSLTERTGASLDRLAPTLSVTALANGGPTRPASILAHPDMPDGLLQPDVRSLVLVGGQEAWSRVTLLPFGRQASPLAVVKVGRLAALRPWARREQAVLAQLEERLEAGLKAGLPRPVATFDWVGLPVAIESCVPGRSLGTELGTWGRGAAEATDDLRRVARWLAEFDLATVQGSLTVDAGWVSALAGLFDRYAARWPGSAEQRLLAEAARRADAAIGLRLPTVWQHTDLGPWNVLQSGAGLGVVDWESARPGPAATDLLYFVGHWLPIARGHRDPRSAAADVRELLLEPASGDRRVRAAREVLAWFFRRLTIDPALLGLVAVRTFAEQALDRAERLAVVGGAAADSLQGERYRLYLRALAAEPTRLLAPVDRWPWSS
ncbi:MAG TPA: phosphotransferase [Candidatus Limnocylindrales bacterium]